MTDTGTSTSAFVLARTVKKTKGQERIKDPAENGGASPNARHVSSRHDLVKFETKTKNKK